MPAWLCHKHVVPSSQGLSSCVRPWLCESSFPALVEGRKGCLVPVWHSWMESWDPWAEEGFEAPAFLPGYPNAHHRHCPNPEFPLSSNVEGVLCEQGHELGHDFLQEKQTGLWPTHIRRHGPGHLFILGHCVLFIVSHLLIWHLRVLADAPSQFLETPYHLLLLQCISPYSGLRGLQSASSAFLWTDIPTTLLS